MRTNGVATMEALGQTVTLPDTKARWRYVYINRDELHFMEDMQLVTI